MSIDKLDVDTTATAKSEWFINEDLDLAYFSIFVSDSVSSYTSTNMDSDPRSAMNALTSLRALIKSSHLVREKMGGAHNAFFEVPAKRRGQKLILFGWIEIEPIDCESSRGNSESPQFFHYEQKSRHMMKKMRYDLIKGSGLNLAKESEHYFFRLYLCHSFHHMM